MRRFFFFVLLVGSAPLAVESARAQTPDAVEVPEARLGSLRATLSGVTADSGNAGFGDLFSGLTALDVATSPLGSPSGGVVFSFVDDTSPLRESVTFTPLLLERAATTGRLTATFGFGITSASYDTVSGFPLGGLPIASFQGSDPIVSLSTLDLGVDVLTTTGYFTLGLSESFDVGVAVPVIGVTLSGSQIVREAAVGTAIFPINASSVGLGDIGVTAKYRFWNGGDHRSGLAAHATLRAPTGNPDELRGIDTWRTMVSGTGSLGVGRLTLHGTAGYEFWNDSIALSNTLPDNLIETWFLGDQLQLGGGFELQAASALTVSLEAVRRHIGRDVGQLGVRGVNASAPQVGISSGQLLGVGEGALTSTVVVPGITVSIEENVLLTFRAVFSVDSTGLRDKITPMLGFSWAQCADC